MCVGLWADLFLEKDTLADYTTLLVVVGTTVHTARTVDHVEYFSVSKYAVYYVNYYIS